MNCCRLNHIRFGQHFVASLFISFLAIVLWILSRVYTIFIILVLNLQSYESTVQTYRKLATFRNDIQNTRANELSLFVFHDFWPNNRFSVCLFTQNDVRYINAFIVWKILFSALLEYDRQPNVFHIR